MKKKLFVFLLTTVMTTSVVPMSLRAEENIEGQDTFILDQSVAQATDDLANFVVPQNNQLHEIVVSLKDMKVYVNSNVIAKVMVKDGATYIPLRTIVKDIYGGDIESTGDGCTIEIENLSLNISLGKKSIEKNNTPINIEAPLMEADGTIYCPVKVLPTLFDMTMTYMEAEKKIVLQAPVEFAPEATTTYANFEFDSPIYVQGQPINVIDSSYDEEGRAIVQRQWMLDGNKKQTFDSIDKLLKKPPVGLHTVSLRVKNDKGKWSEWVERVLTIDINQKPVVTQISGTEQKYAQGEKFTLGFEYTNEEWEQIKEEKWSYKKKDESDSSWMYSKPEFFFRQGEYDVRLSIQDEYGNWSDAFMSTIYITDEVLDTELNYKFGIGIPGTIIDNYENRNFREIEEVQLTPAGEKEGKLIFSDSPEVVTADGILYREELDGDGRINFHHINNYDDSVARNKKLVIIAENTTDQPVTMIVRDKAIRGPAQDCVYAGQLLAYHYLRGNGYVTYELKPKQKMFLVDTKEKNWIKGTTLAAQLDINTTGNVKFTIASADKNAKIEDVEKSPILARDVHPRGTYFVTDLYYNIVADGTKETCFLIGKGQDEWCQGIDGITGEAVMNRGNYGIVYHISITAEEDMGVLINPRGGSYRGAVRIDTTKTFRVPENGILRGSNKAAVVTTIKKGETQTIDYILPNGSASPNLFALIPKSMWK